MKIRISNNSLRIRLTEKEVQILFQQGSIEEILTFGPEIFDRIVYRLNVTAVSDILVSYNMGIISIELPGIFVNDWHLSDLGGYNGQIETAKGMKMEFKLEKDLPCVHKEN